MAAKKIYASRTWYQTWNNLGTQNRVTYLDKITPQTGGTDGEQVSWGMRVQNGGTSAISFPCRQEFWFDDTDNEAMDSLALQVTWTCNIWSSGAAVASGALEAWVGIFTINGRSVVGGEYKLPNDINFLTAVKLEELNTTTGPTLNGTTKNYTIPFTKTKAKDLYFVLNVINNDPASPTAAVSNIYTGMDGFNVSFDNSQYMGVLRLPTVSTPTASYFNFNIVEWVDSPINPTRSGTWFHQLEYLNDVPEGTPLFGKPHLVNPYPDAFDQQSVDYNAITLISSASKDTTIFPTLPYPSSPRWGPFWLIAGFDTAELITSVEIGINPHSLTGNLNIAAFDLGYDFNNSIAQSLTNQPAPQYTGTIVAQPINLAAAFPVGGYQKWKFLKLYPDQTYPSGIEDFASNIPVEPVGKITLTADDAGSGLTSKSIRFPTAMAYNILLVFYCDIGTTQYTNTFDIHYVQTGARLATVRFL